MQQFTKWADPLKTGDSFCLTFFNGVVILSTVTKDIAPRDCTPGHRSK
jgi:hypothetical protein